MKSLVVLLEVIILSTFLCCNNSNASNEFEKNDKLSEITFEKTTHDYGTIEYGGNGIYEFVFKNTGEQLLVLNNVSSSCGCTVPEWPREPIDKGKEAKIKVKYNTNKAGNFQKTVTVYSNAKNSPVVLKIKGKVKASPDKLEKTNLKKSKNK